MSGGYSRFRQLARQVGPLNALIHVLGEDDVEAVCVCGGPLSALDGECPCHVHDE
jgi:hypothetical protein